MSKDKLTAGQLKQLIGIVGGAADELTWPTSEALRALVGHLKRDLYFTENPGDKDWLFDPTDGRAHGKP